MLDAAFTRRSLAVCCAIALAVNVGVLGSTALAQDTFTVNLGTDAVDADVGDGFCDIDEGDEQEDEDCTLRAAVQEANATSASDVIAFNVSSVILTIADNGEDVTGTSGDLDVIEDVVIDGGGVLRTVLQDAVDRVFQVFSETDVDMNDLRIRSGEAEEGGGIWSDGDLTLNGVIVDSNEADEEGGGVWASGLTRFIDVTVSNNQAGHGGGLYTGRNADVTIDHTTFSNNVATGADESGGDGGAIWNDAVMEIENSTISGNDAAGDGGGLMNAFPGDVVSRANTFYRNVAESGVPTAGGNVQDETAIQQEGRTVTFRMTILYGGVPNNCNGEQQSASYNDIGFNLDSDGTCSMNGEGSSIVNEDPLLAPLGSNGGPTQTHALRRGSPALDAIPTGEVSFCPPPSDDQRHEDRPADGDGDPDNGTGCDIGAFEKQEDEGFPGGGGGGGPAECADGVDNDEDGNIDEEDLGCSSSSDDTEAGEPTPSPTPTPSPSSPRPTPSSSPSPTPTPTPRPTRPPDNQEARCVDEAARLGLNLISGTNDDDVLTGTSEGDLFCAKDGDDQLTGFGGGDVFWMGRGNDAALGGDGDDTFRGGRGRDVAYGGTGADLMTLGDDDDRGRGAAGDDRIFGMQQSDELLGGAGEDHLYGGPAEDTCFGGPGTDTVNGCP